MLFQSKRGNLLLLGGSQLPAKLVHQNHQEGDGGDSGTHWDYPHSFLLQGQHASLFLNSKSWRGRKGWEKEGEGGG